MVWSRKVLLIGAAVGGLAAAATPIAQADGGGGGQIPSQVFAPYFETFLPGNPALISHESGARDLIFAFLQTAAPGSCTVDWNGDPSTPVAWSQYGSEIQEIRDHGGDVWPSFGGYSADTTGTDLADSCASVPAIAAEYERVITTYDFTRLDFDIEANSLSNGNGNANGITDRNQAIAVVQQWAAAHHRTLQIVYTLPVAQSGPLAPEDNVLSNAIANGVRIDIVNALTFDYYGGEPNEMATDTMTAAEGTLSELQLLYPHAPTWKLWRMVGVTDMIGIDDYGPDETLTFSDAGTVESWAAEHHLGLLSFWALQRDNGSCPFTGTQATWSGASNSCSSVVQSTWQYSHIFEPFTREFPFSPFGHHGNH
ncbi:MAG: glycosyl hydrolase family 18 protein [Candidatus Dormiibacterota bacterium]